MDDEGYIPRLYGRRQDRPLRQRQAMLIETLLRRIEIPEDQIGPLHPGALFPSSKEIWLEIGFGGGEHLAAQAKAHPEIGLIGAEPFLNGVAKLLSEIDERGLENIRILFGDARPLLERLEAASLSRIFVLYPDPWPKKRHWKRRIISPWFLRRAAELLKPGGQLRIASDIPDYIRWSLMHAQAEPALEWTARNPADWRDPPEDWSPTRYEQKAKREGRTPAYLTFVRC